MVRTVRVGIGTGSDPWSVVDRVAYALLVTRSPAHTCGGHVSAYARSHFVVSALVVVLLYSGVVVSVARRRYE